MPCCCPVCAHAAVELKCHLQVSLDRFDLFHAHLFVADAGAGLLFHASEYPALGPDFGCNLGFCQVESPLRYSEAKMSWRNLVFMKASVSDAKGCLGNKRLHVPIRSVSCHLQGRLFAIDLTGGSFLFSRMLSRDLYPFRTAQDHDFGRVVADVNFFPQLSSTNTSSLYICEYH